MRRLTPRYDPDLVVIGYCLDDAEDWFQPDGVMALRIAAENLWKFLVEEEYIPAATPPGEWEERREIPPPYR